MSRPRRGRPPAREAGAVDRRILDAASELFLSQGYDATSIDQVAEVARASKATVYSRHSDKAELFHSVVRRSVAVFAASTAVPADGSCRERLIAIGLALADETLTAPMVSLMRVTSAEAAKFPEIASEGFRIGFGECVDVVARSLIGGDRAANLDVETLATRFVEMALHPLYMHAFFGADLEDLRRRARDDVVRIADLLLASYESTT